MTASEDDNRAQRAKMAGSILVAAAILAVVCGITIAIGAIARKPGLDGILTGIFGGFFVALLIMGAGAWLGITTVTGRPKAPDLSAGDALASSLKHVLDELERARLETVAAINQRALLRVPLCVAGGMLLWLMGQFGDDPSDLGETAALIIVPALLGYVWASMKLSNAYALKYKARVLPELAKSFGDISYRHAIAPDLSSLQAEGVFRKFDSVTADDEFFGTHRNLPISIVELKLEIRQSKNTQTVFDGLLMTLDLPRDTGAVTAVISDAGSWGNFADRMKSQKRERVRLEDPVFEKVYEVYGTDQVAARALLNPAFMERMLKLGERPDFGQPLALCSGRMLQIAMPKKSGRDLFEPPSFQKPAASRLELIQLQTDLATMIAAADAVIDLDHRFEIMARK